MPQIQAALPARSWDEDTTGDPTAKPELPRVQEIFVAFSRWDSGVVCDCSVTHLIRTSQSGLCFPGPHPLKSNTLGPALGLFAHLYN